MGKAIAVMKQHGFHEPVVAAPWEPDESNPLVVEARSLGIDIEKTIYAGGRPLAHKAWVSSLKSEIRAVKEARKNPWDTLEDSNLRQRVRAIQAEQEANDLKNEVSMLKTRLKQADNGKGDWIEERDALLLEIESLRREEEKPKTKEESVVTQSLRAQVESLNHMLDKMQQESAHLIKQNSTLAASITEMKDEIEEHEQTITNWQERFQEEHQAYLTMLKERDALKVGVSDQDTGINHDYEVITRLQEELAGYKAANKRLVEANEKLQDELDRADSAGFREAPDEVAWLRSRVEYLESKLR